MPKKLHVSTGRKKIKVKVIGQISINKKIGGINIIFSWPGALFEKKKKSFLDHLHTSTDEKIYFVKNCKLLQYLYFIPC